MIAVGLVTEGSSSTAGVRDGINGHPVVEDGLTIDLALMMRRGW